MRFPVKRQIPRGLSVPSFWKDDRPFSATSLNSLHFSDQFLPQLLTLSNRNLRRHPATTEIPPNVFDVCQNILGTSKATEFRFC